MNIKEFEKKYKDSPQVSIEAFLKRCAERKELDDLLGTEIVAGLTLVDVLDGELYDTRVSEEVLEPLKRLREEISTQGDALSRFREKISNGTDSVNGEISYIKGTLGELKFKEASGLNLELAKKANQEGWDLKTDTGEYIQVKMNKSPQAVIKAIEENNEKLEIGKIKDMEDIAEGGKEITVKHIDYAVSSESYEKLKDMEIDGVSFEKYHNIKLYEVPMAAGEAGEIVGEEINETAWSEFFDDVLGVPLQAFALHGAINTFLFAFEKKSKQEAIHDTIKSTIFTAIAGNIGNVSSVIALGIIPFPPIGIGVGFTAAVVSRSALRRVESRWSWVDFMSKENERLAFITERLIVIENPA